MAVKWCTAHQIGFNTDLDPSCPQCAIARSTPAPTADSKEAAEKARA